MYEAETTREFLRGSAVEREESVFRAGGRDSVGAIKGSGAILSKRLLQEPLPHAVAWVNF